MQFDLDSFWVGCVSESGKLNIIDFRKWQVIKTLNGNALATGVRCKGLAMEENTGLLGSVFSDGVVRIWDNNSNSNMEGMDWTYREVRTGCKAECITGCTISGRRSRRLSSNSKQMDF